MWFVTGLVMLYAPFPSWSDEERVDNLPAIAGEAVRVLPDEALAEAALGAMPSTFQLEMLGDEPVYRLGAADKRVTLSAVSGKQVTRVSQDDAAKHVATVYPGLRPTFEYALDADQWTPTRRFDPHRPLYRFALNDAAGTVVYVSSQTGEIVQNATFAERAWNWVGAVPHWIYFTPIRRDQELWRQAVMWLSGPLVIGAISGVWIGLLRLRPGASRRGRSVSPYRGWMKWHHIAGLVGGLFLTTWIFSGWLSVNPFKMFARTQLTAAQLTAFAGWTADSRIGLTRSALGQLRGASDVSFAWVDGRAIAIARGRDQVTLADPSTGERVVLKDADLVSSASRMFPETTVRSAQRLESETLYWYSHHDKRPLPVIEVALNDAAATSVYVDPATGSIAGHRDRSSRAYRWLFSFFHDYDLPLLLRNQPARDIVVWLLSLAGLIVSISGVVIGWRTLKRELR